MPILPIDMGRYGSHEMKAIFEEEGKLQRLLDVEAALAWALAEVGDIPKEASETIGAMASVKHVRLNRVKEIEAKIRHDIMAVVTALSEVCGPSGAYVHLGATSNDITDSATALQLKDALKLISQHLNDLEAVLMELSEANKHVLLIGRTHGQHAIPMTLGFKFVVWLRETSRHIQRLEECTDRVVVGKMSGAVGTQAGLGPNAMKVQHLTMSRLGIMAADVSTQIVQRDRYAELICLFAIIASSLDKFAIEIRELQRPEIGELAEPFASATQVGSSTMPHKKNPILCERVCGLAKILRSLTIPALENVPTWHERDITQSSAERFILPEAFILLEYMLSLITRVLRGLHIDREKMRANVDLTGGRAMSESIMLALTKKGFGRQKAHSLVRDVSLQSERDGTPFRDDLLAHPVMRQYLSTREMDEALNPMNYLGTTLEQIDAMIKKTETEREKRVTCH
ncbi:MAG: adenylosuccinate lyase [Candidatus Bathyarchaeia archaeon]